MIMKLKLAVATCCLALTACPTGGGTVDSGVITNTDAGSTTAQRIDVSADITANTTWSKVNTYILKTLVYVDGATLTIEAGTKILGDSGSALIVTKTGKLMAVGSATEPIVFTVNAVVGMRGVANNNWGGLMLNGKAAINVVGGDNLAEGVVDGPRNRYGGGATPDNAHNCGTLKYVRIEFAGQPLSANNELNGLTLNACGSATVVDYVQVHRGIDDGIEIFGGSVNIKHAVITGSDDDGLDWDQGWTGNGQFIIVQQLPGRGNMGIEADSNRNGQDLMPRSNPTLSNVTLIGRSPDNSNTGEGTSRGIVFRVGTAGKLHNAIVTNFNDWALYVDGSSSKAQWESGELVIKNSVFFHNKTAAYQNVLPPALADGGVAADLLDESLALAAPSLNNRSIDPQLTDGLSATAPNFKPVADSAVLMGGVVPAGEFFESSATFAGAIGTTDWTAGWTAYPEN